MQKLIIAILMVALVTGGLFAGSKAPESKDETDHSMHKSDKEHGMHAGHDAYMPMNNVFAINKKGERKALCGCGMEVAVNDDTPVETFKGMTFWTCGETCAEMMKGMSEAEMDNAMKIWHEKFDGYKLASNTEMKDGKEMATCGCGMVFEVSDDNPRIVENGMVLHMCGDNCKNMVMEMPAEKRLKMEKKMTKSGT